MQTVQQQLQDAVNAALSTIVNGASPPVAPDTLRVVPCANPQFGDYQFNGALPIANALARPGEKANARGLAQSIIASLDVTDVSETPEIAGPGFINFRLKRDFVERATAEALMDSRLGVPVAAQPKTVVIDYPSPNLAKPLHVGHLRPAVIGDAIARLLRFTGHKVISDNHVGDWGTQFGMIILGWKKYGDEARLVTHPLEEMERLYKMIQTEAKTDTATAEAARTETAKLQSGDVANRALWQRLLQLADPTFQSLYDRLDVHTDVTLGESFYDARLGPLVQEMKEQGIAEESEGAIIVKFDTPPQLAGSPLLIQKSDGSALYGTTDLATIEYRVKEWHPDQIVYVVDARQALHFQQVFAAVRKWGYTAVDLRHVAFGTILGEDGKPIRTRSGESVKLSDLLDEAEARALAIVGEKNPDLPEAQQREVARVIGIGALKYADLSQNRTSDYLFSWDKLLAMQGNTAPYLLNAYVRIRAIFRRAEREHVVPADTQPAHLTLEHAAELDLAKFILRFGLTIETALGDYRLNALSDYLFELAQKYHVFFENCPVLKSEEPVLSSRLALCTLTAAVLKQGLNILGIEIVEQM